jgi:sulfite exporter TauE/SafE
MAEAALLSFFITGLLAGTHCAGMCGGIVTAVSLSRGPKAAPSLAHLLAFNAGRIASYTAAGAIVGAVGAGSLLLGPQQPIQIFLFLAANVLLIALGLHLAGLWHAVTVLERLGAVVWRRISPFTQRLLPVRNSGQAFALGGLWGWLPCGLVYSILTAALASGHPINGALTMAAFGLGTLPNLIAMGYFADRIRPLLQRRGVRLAAGSMIIAFGLLGLARSQELAVAYGSALLCHTIAVH